MNGTELFIRYFGKTIKSQKQIDLLMETLIQIGQQIPNEKKIGLFKNLAEKHLGAILDGMSQEERVKLMNSLLPVIVREFPLAKLDFASAFPSQTETTNETQRED